MQELRDLQRATGANFTETGLPSTFGQDAEALVAVKTGVALFDRSHWGLIQLSGEDRLRFLHNQTTNTFEQRQPGEGCDTVFVTSTARTLDLVNVYVTEETLLILTSPGQDQRLLDWMDRYIFPADRVALTNLTGTMALFSLVGPQGTALLSHQGLDLEAQAAYGQHQQGQLGDVTLRVAMGSGLSLPGWTMIIPMEGAASVWQTLTQGGAIPAGETLWQQLRVQQGRPLPGTELTEDYNPLEAGLWQSISFDKGCYIGQETIARLNTYQGVKQQLWGIRLDAMVEASTPIKLAGEKVGTLTSVVDTADGPWG
ncbi:MAG: folate-binding protein YgfZ [Leptolyngbyaceae cyanobacterium SM2_3_12]|nr:folate-binding protein YgfZ [Leptolyngbyaceae cyanobacterium SM2_3_12]